MDDRRSQHLYGLGVVAVALLLGLFFVSGALKDIRKGNEEVTVTGSARRPIRSDFVVWRFTVSVQSSSMVSASQELSRGTDRVRAFLKEQGVADSLLTVKPVEASGVSETLPDGRETGRVIATRLSQAFEIRSYDVDGVTKVSQQASEAIPRCTSQQSNGERTDPTVDCTVRMRSHSASRLAVTSAPLRT